MCFFLTDPHHAMQESTSFKNAYTQRRYMLASLQACPPCRRVEPPASFIKVETVLAQLKEVCNLMKPGHLRKLLVAVIVVGLDRLIAVIAA